MMTVIAIGIALFFAMNIGASGAAASLGIAYGTGAIQKKKWALFISGIGIFLGAAFGSKAVITTIGSGIIASHLLSNEVVIILLISACFTLFIANVIGIPLSTSEVTVGAVIGVGIAYRSVYVGEVIHIVSWWVIAPVIACIFIWVIRYTLLKMSERYLSKINIPQIILIIFITIAGFLEAIAAGMNNVANAVGPLVGSNILGMNEAMMIGGICIALGAYLLGGRVLETNGKKITTLSLTDGVIVSATGAIIAIIASLYGIPIPMTQITTAGIIGISIANNGVQVFGSSIMKRIIVVWVASPLISLTIAYGLFTIFIKNDHVQSTIFSWLFAFVIFYSIYIFFYRKRKSKQRSVVK